MAEATSKDTITRQALGRIARLGDLYDARADRFCATNMFKQQLPPDSPAICRTDNHTTDTSVTIDSSLNEKLRTLDVNGEQKLSILSGIVEVNGSGKYISHEKTSFKSVESTLLCKITTVHESLQLYDTDLKSDISIDALRNTSHATHVVVEIHWGANCAITVTDQNSENNTKHSIEGNLKAEVEKLKGSISATVEAEAEYKKEKNDNRSNPSKFSVKIFGDVLPDEFPHTMDGALSMMRNMGHELQRCNNGKGKPLSFVLLPLSSPFFQNYIGLADLLSPTVRNIAEKQIVEVIQVFDRIVELRQKVHDQVVEIGDRGHCVTSSDREEARSLENSLEVQQASVRSELDRVLQEVRSANSDGRCLEHFCVSHRSAANEKFRKCDDIYKVIQSRIMFAGRCEKYGAKYLHHPVDDSIASACDDYENVYVLIDGQADAGTTKTNRTAFIELAKGGRGDSTTAFYFTWTDSTGGVKIEHYRNNKLVQNDVNKELETKDMVQCIPATRGAFSLQPFKVRCPGSLHGDCSKEERSWTCMDCNQLLQYCPPYDACTGLSLYCGCGHAEMRSCQFQFRCRCETLKLRRIQEQ